jgi:hypothetical protein
MYNDFAGKSVIDLGCGTVCGAGMIVYMECSIKAETEAHYTASS